MPQLRPMYCRHCRQTLYTDDMVKCSACGQTGGMLDPNDPAALEDLAAAKREEENAPLQAAGGILAAYRSLKLGCVGVGCLMMGVMLLSSPMMWSDPRGPTLNDAVPAVMAFLVGLFLLTIVVAPMFLGPGSSDRRDGPKGP